MKSIDIVNKLSDQRVNDLGLACDLYDEMHENDKQKLRDYVNVDTLRKGTLIQVHNISGIIETLEKILICKDNCDELCAIYNSHKGVCDNDIAIKEAIKILKEVKNEKTNCVDNDHMFSNQHTS